MQLIQLINQLNSLVFIYKINFYFHKRHPAPEAPTHTNSVRATGPYIRFKICYHIPHPLI